MHLCDCIQFCEGENDVEYAEFSMTQRMLLRESSPAAASGATVVLTTPTDKSFEDKIMLYQLFDRLERVPSPTLANAGYTEMYADAGLAG